LILLGALFAWHEVRSILQAIIAKEVPVNRLSCIAAASALAAGLAACGDDPTPADRRAGNPPLPKVATGATSIPAAQPLPAGQLAADMELSSKVKQALRAPDVGAAPTGYVEVAATDGVVTLNGTVDVPAEKERAALAALGVEGVRSVINNLVVVRGS
jgi:osmotically-inducible protein OsmY